MDAGGPYLGGGDSRDSRDSQTYEDDRTRGLRRGRLVGYALCIALWLFSAIPLARLSSDEGGGADVAAAYLVAGLGIALLSRWIYARLKRKPFWSPWVFAIAAVLAIASYGIQSAGERAASAGLTAASMPAPAAIGWRLAQKSLPPAATERGNQYGLKIRRRAEIMLKHG